MFRHGDTVRVRNNLTPVSKHDHLSQYEGLEGTVTAVYESVTIGPMVCVGFDNLDEYPFHPEELEAA